MMPSRSMSRAAAGNSVMPKSEPFWWEDAGAPTSPPIDVLPGAVDVLVVGAGLTGLTAARTLARRGRSVLVADAGPPGIGASSRNGGMVLAGHRQSLEHFESRYGTELGHRMLREAHVDMIRHLEQLMAEEEIACDYARTGRFKGFWRPSEYDSAGREIDRLGRIVPLEAELIPRARQSEEIATELYSGGVVYRNAAALNPAKWMFGILAGARRAGAIVAGETPVLALEREGAGWCATTPRGKVRSGEVLVATNGYTPSHLPTLKRRIIPVPSFIVATEVLGENRVRSLIPKLRTIGETRDRHCYYRPSPDGRRIVFGGRAAMFDVSEAVALSQMRGLLAQVFPELRDVGITHSWRGRTGFTFDFVPHVGRIDGVWHAMGYSGSGNAMAPWLGHKAGLKIVGDPDGETAFSHTPFSTRWWHRGTAWFLPFVDMGFRVKDVNNNLMKRWQ